MVQGLDSSGKAMHASEGETASGIVTVDKMRKGRMLVLIRKMAREIKSLL